MNLPHNLRINSRILSALDVNFFSILNRILVVAVIAVAFLTFLTVPNSRHVSKINALENVVRHSPSDFNKRLQLALLYEQEFKKTGNLQNLERALVEGKIAQQLDTGNLSAAKLLAQLNELNSTEIKEEILKVEQIVKVRPDYAAAWLKLATLYEKLGDQTRADSARNRAKLLNGNF